MLSVFALNLFTVITVVYSCTPVDGPWPRFGLKDKPTRLAVRNREQCSSSKSCIIHQTSSTCTQTSPKVRGCSFHSGQQKQDTWGGVVRGKRHMAAEVKILVEVYASSWMPEGWQNHVSHQQSLHASAGKCLYSVASNDNL